jgi:hypothetical protein
MRRSRARTFVRSTSVGPGFQDGQMSAQLLDYMYSWEFNIFLCQPRKSRLEPSYP